MLIMSKKVFYCHTFQDIRYLFDVNADIENEILKNIIIKTIQEDLLETKIVDIVVVFKKISIGLDEPIYFLQ